MGASTTIAGGTLVRLPNWLGDALMARPFLAALRAAAPAPVIAQGPAALLALMAGDGAWDEAVPWPAGAAAAPALRSRRVDTAYVLPPSFSSAWHARRAGARRVVGFAGDARSWLLTRAMRRPARGERHLALEYLALLGEAPDAPPVPAVLPLGPTAAHEAASARAGAGGSGPYAIVAPGAVYGPAKRWPAERFTEVARGLAADGLAVLACGGAGERESCDAVAAGAGAIALAGRTTLRAQAALCAGAAVVVSNDSGMAHLAAAVGAPTVTIFGSTSSAWTAPLGPRVRIVQRPPVCAPCFARTCRVGFACQAAVGVDDVLAAARALVREGRT